MTDRLRCHHCCEVIGVYEPLITLVEGRAHETSRALEPGTTNRVGDHYHRACYERLDDQLALTEQDSRPSWRATP